jgi:hypothetical protein
VTVLSMQVVVSGATLNTTGSSVSLVPIPTTLEIGRLLVGTTFVSTTTVRAGTYDSATFTFSSPELTIFNGSGADIGTCLVGTVCQFTPTLSPAAVTYSGAPFPLTVDINSPFGLQLDFDLNRSLANDLLSISPSVTVTQLTSSGTPARLEDESIVGQIAVVDPVNNGFTVQNHVNGLVFAFQVDASTVYEGFSAASLASLAVGQIVEVDARLVAGGTFQATRVSLKESAGAGLLGGTITSVDSLTQFKMVVYRVEPLVVGVLVGDPVTVTIQSGASFDPDLGDLAPPVGLSFGSASDLMVGQSVHVRPLEVAAGTVTTDRVRLRRALLTAQVFQKADPDLVVTPSPGLFATASPTGVIAVDTAQAIYQNVAGFFALNVGDTIIARGFLFKNPVPGTAPTLVADTVRKKI